MTSLANHIQKENDSLLQGRTNVAGSYESTGSYTAPHRITGTFEATGHFGHESDRIGALNYDEPIGQSRQARLHSGSLNVQSDQNARLHSGSLNGDAYDSQKNVEIEILTRERSNVSKSIRNVILALVNVAFNVAMNVVLPMYAGTMDYIKADAYVLLSQACIFFVIILALMTQALHYVLDSRISLAPTASYKILFLMGLLTTLNGILVVYASPPDRTPPYLQGILATTSIIFTVLCRIVWLRKGINLPRSLCVFAVLVGLTITVLPQFWNLPGSGSGPANTSESSIARILWPLCFMLGFLPYGMMNVICEKELKKGEGQSFSFITWTQMFQVVTMYMMFWTDFIPGFGMADSPSDLVDRLRVGWHCYFSLDQACHNMISKAWMFNIIYCLANLFQFLLIQYAEGAVYAAVVQASVSPLVALFWTLFKYDVSTDHFYWQPQFTETTAFTSVGVCIIVPAIALYNYVSIQEEKEKIRKPAADVKL